MGGAMVTMPVVGDEADWVVIRGALQTGVFVCV